MTTSRIRQRGGSVLQARDAAEGGGAAAANGWTMVGQSSTNSTCNGIPPTRWRAVGITAATVVAILLSCLPALACPGDCDRDCQVDVVEIINGIAIALGDASVDGCRSFDRDASGTVEVDELVAAVNAALHGCPRALHFTPARRYATGLSPRSLAVGDFNGDGRPDIAAANHVSHDVSILLQQPDGSFAPESRFATGMIPLGIVAADLNGDGNLDIATANGGSGDVSVLLGRGDGTFQPELRSPAGNGARTILAVDIDHDAILDLLVAAPGGNGIPLLVGRGDGQFDRVVIGSGFRPWWIAHGDVTGDGTADLVTANAESRDVTILAGFAAGGFSLYRRIALAAAPYSVQIADLDRDGAADLVTGNGTDASVTLLRGVGAGAFAAAVRITMGDGPYPAHVADIDADGMLDLVTANELSGDASIRLGTGSASFGDETRVPLGASPFALALTDIDGDGHLDLLAATGRSDDVTLRLARHCNGR